MHFNKIEKFLIKLFALQNSEFSTKIFQNLYLWKNKLFKTNNGLNIQKTNVDRNNINDIPAERKEGGSKNSGKGGAAKANLNTRKIVWTVVIILIVLVLIGLLVLSTFRFSSVQLNVREVTTTGDTNNTSYVLNLTDGARRTIFATDRPNFFLTSAKTIEVTFGNSSFNSFFYNALIIDQPLVLPQTPTTQNTSNGTSNGTQAATTTNNNIVNLPVLWVQVANLTINTTTGDVFKFVNTTEGNTNSTPSPNTAMFQFDPTLTGSIGTSFRALTASLSSNKPLPFSFQPITSVIFSFLPFLLFISLIYFSMRRMGSLGGGMGGDNVFTIGKSQAKLAQTNVLFSDVAGIQEEKEELIEIVDYLKRPERYASMGARVPKGVILYGPPGTGKTLLAKAVAGEAKVPFFQVSGSAFEDMLVGVGAKRVRDLFNKAIKSAPAIIFIDEIDSVGSKRGKFETTAGSLADQTLNQLLAEMDGFNSRTGVIVMAATNRLDVLDDALLRPGRFDRHIQVTLPDIKERTAILKIHSRNKNLSTSVDLDDISRRTPGFSGAQLENVLNEATLLAVRRNRKTISTEDLDEAIDRVIAGPAKKTRVISAAEKKQIAYHEAGHAVVGLHTKGSEVVEKITIIPRGQAAGYTLSVPEVQELAIKKKSDLLGMIAGLLGGRASEALIFGSDDISTGAANDFYKATNIVRAMVTQLGMSKVGITQFYPSEGTINPYQQKLFSEKTAQEIDKEIEAILQERYAYAAEIIKNNRLELDLIVESLLLLETIIKPQIDYIHKYHKLPKEAVERKKELAEKEKAAALIKKVKSKKESADNQKVNEKTAETTSLDEAELATDTEPKAVETIPAELITEEPVVDTYSETAETLQTTESEENAVTAKEPKTKSVKPKAAETTEDSEDGLPILPDFEEEEA